MGDLYLGNSAGSNHPIILSGKEREKHLHIIGGTRRGKSTLVRRMILDDIKAGHGVCVFDPHGSLIYGLLCDLAKTERPFGKDWPIRLLEPGRDDFITRFDPLKNKAHQHETALRLVNAILAGWNIFDESQVPRLTRVLYAIIGLTSELNLPLAEALTLLRDPRRIEDELNKIKSLNLKSEWQALLADKKAYWTLVESSLNRLSQLVGEGASKNMFALAGGGLDLFEIVNGRSIFLLNLAQSDALPSRTGDIIGTVIFNELKQAAMKRDTTGGKKPRPFYVYVDECARYLNSDVLKALDECSKFGMQLILVHQRFAQLRERSEEVLSGVLDIQNHIVFGGSGVDDMDYLVKELFSGHIAMDEFIPGTQEAMTVGHRRQKKLATSKASSEVLTNSKQQSASAGTAEGTGDTLNYGASLAPTGTVEDETAPTIPNRLGFNLGKSKSGSQSVNSANQFGSGEALAKGQTHTVNETTELVPIWDMSKGQRYGLEEQYERLRGQLRQIPPYHAYLSQSGAKPVLFAADGAHDAKTPEGMNRQAEVYERFRKKIFSQMCAREEAISRTELEEILSKAEKVREETVPHVP